MQKKRNLGVIIGILIVVLIALILISIAAGRYVIRSAEILQLFKHRLQRLFILERLPEQQIKVRPPYCFSPDCRVSLQLC